MRCTLIALALGLAAVAGAADAVAAEAPSIAVVDMAELVRKHPDAQTLDTRLKSAQDAAKVNWDAQQERLRELKTKISTMPETSPERRTAEKNFERTRVNNEFSRKWALASAVDQYVRSLEVIYKEVVARVRNYAKAKGIKLVLQRESTDQIRSANFDDFFVKLRLRTVVHYDITLDITTAILAEIQK